MEKETKASPYHHLFRVLHWVLGLSMIVMLGTGFALHSIARPDWSTIGHFPAHFPAGRIMLWHLIGALFFVPSALISIFLFLRRFKPKAAHFKQLRWIANYLLVIGSIVAILSSIGSMYNTTGVLHMPLRTIHSINGLILLPIAFIIHVVLACSVHIKILPYVFFPFRQPRWAAFAWIPVIALLTTAFINQFPLKKTHRRLLVAERTTQTPPSTEGMRDMAWDSSKPLNIRVANGSGFDHGSTVIDLRAMHDGEWLYVRAKWADTTDSTLYWPVKKTADGWEYMETSWNDERVNYEDKFSLAFPIAESMAFNQFGCAITCHQDTDIKRFPYGYKAVNEPMDVWHWKASRTGSVGHADDKYWHLANMELKDVGRYGDGGEGGGYIKNINKEKTAPLYLPKDDSYIINKGGALLKEGAVEYSEELAAKIPVGTLVPGVVVSPNNGDRGDVKCTHEYVDGHHILWLRRKLDTQNKDDVKFIPGESVAFGAAAFDHAAKRHAYHMTVYRMLIAE